VALQKGQIKTGQVLLTPADLTKRAELTIQPYVTINGMTRPSKLIDPPFGTSLGIATEVVKLASDIFDLSSRIYDKITPCINVGPINSNGNNAYLVQISNCSNQYEPVDKEGNRIRGNRVFSAVHGMALSLLTMVTTVINL
jgi:hypothetical protein